MIFQPFNYILLKLAARCNINCTYCYWFKDDSVYQKPKVLSEEAEFAFYQKLEQHIVKYNLTKFSILFHGGEPLLIGKKRLFKICNTLKEISTRTNCQIPLAITTNGILIDEEYASIFYFFNISVTISIDGTKAIHDKSRVHFDGSGSYQEVVNSIYLLRRFNIKLGILAVCNPSTEPGEIFKHFVEDLKIEHFDILFPDATYESRDVTSISPYYKSLFNLWYGEGKVKKADIRIMKSIVLGLLGYNTTSEGLGYGPIQTLTMLTNGALEPLDVLRIAGNGSTSTTMNIFDNELQDVTEDKVWRSAYTASVNLHEKCKACDYKNACGGGYLPHRWSNADGYNNPSVYCDDLMDIFSSAWSKISTELNVVTPEKEIPLHTLIT